MDDDGKRRLEEALADDQCPLNWLVLEFAELFQLPLPKLVWEPTPPAEGHNNARCASYRQRLLAPNGHTAIGAWVRLEAPDLSDWTTLALVDVRFDFAALRAVKPDTAEPLYRPTSADINEVLKDALKGATEVLPLALRGGPSGVRPVGSTVAELHIDSERPAQHQGSGVRLCDRLDFALLGEPPADLGPAMATAMVIQPRLNDQEIADVAFQLLFHMVSSYRFVLVDD